ncbi:unnamed protein product [Sphagnum balticum]
MYTTTRKESMTNTSVRLRTVASKDSAQRDIGRRRRGRQCTMGDLPYTELLDHHVCYDGCQGLWLWSSGSNLAWVTGLKV